MQDYQDIGLGKNLSSLQGPAGTPRPFVTALENDYLEEQSPYAPRTQVAKGNVSSRGYITLLSGGAEGGAVISFYTNETTPQNLNNTEVLLNPDDYPGAKFYLETICRAGTQGEASRTLVMDLYDVTGGSVVANGTVTTSTTEGAPGPGALVRARSTVDFRPYMAKGDRTYILRYNNNGGTLFVDVYEARLIIDF